MKEELFYVPARHKFTFGGNTPRRIEHYFRRGDYVNFVKLIFTDSTVWVRGYDYYGASRLRKRKPFVIPTLPEAEVPTLDELVMKGGETFHG